MKKKIFIYTLISLLISTNSLKAEETCPAKQINPKNNFSEIILDTKQDFDLPSSLNALTDEKLTGEAANSDEQATLENNSCCKKKKFEFFVHLNPIRPIEKTQCGIENCANCVNKKVDKNLHKLDGTPLKVIPKTDKVIDTSVEKTDTAVKKVFGYLDKGTNFGLNKMDEAVNLAADKTAIQEWLNGDYAARKYFGMRPLLESHGVTIDSSFLYSPFMKTAGGANGEASEKGYSMFSLGVTLDTEAANLWKGGKFFALYQRKTGYGLSGSNGAMGDYYGFDGWDIPQINQISEYWYQQKLFNGKVRMKFGKQDSNTDFGFLNSGWDFMNSAFSVNPNTPLPTYPYTPFGFMFEVSPKEWLSIRDGIYSKENAPFNITELEFKPMIKKMPGRYMLGAWEMSDSNGYSVATDMDSNGTIYNNFNRNFGLYFNFEQMVYKEQKENPNDMQGLVVFGQLGMSPSGKNDLSKYGAVGLHYKGPFPKRDNDLVGIALGCGNFASRLNNITYDLGGRTGSETVLEGFYRLFITKWFYLQPDVQFIMNPSGQYQSSVAIGIRSVITF